MVFCEIIGLETERVWLFQRNLLAQALVKISKVVISLWCGVF